MRFKIVVPTYNCFQWLPRCFDSIAKQSYRNFDVVVWDDHSQESGQWEWTQHYCQKAGWLSYRAEKNEGCLASLVYATRAIDPCDSDVIVHVDGDDWLAHDRVLEHVASVYERGGVDLTFGQFRTYPDNQLGYPSEPPKELVRSREYRMDQREYWGHLRTFKAFLWKALCDEDLRSPTGEYFRFATDHAFMHPMMEMVGERFAFISDVLYIYNGANPNAESWMEIGPREATERYIRLMEPYPRRAG